MSTRRYRAVSRRALRARYKRIRAYVWHDPEITAAEIAKKMRLKAYAVHNAIRAMGISPMFDRHPAKAVAAKPARVPHPRGRRVVRVYRANPENVSFFVDLLFSKIPPKVLQQAKQSAASDLLTGVLG